MISCFRCNLLLFSVVHAFKLRLKHRLNLREKRDKSCRSFEKKVFLPKKEEQQQVYPTLSILQTILCEDNYGAINLRRKTAKLIRLREWRDSRRLWRRQIKGDSQDWDVKVDTLLMRSLSKDCFPYITLWTTMFIMTHFEEGASLEAWLEVL